MTLGALPQATKTGSMENRRRHKRSATLPTRLPQIFPKSTLISPIISDLNPTARIDVLHPPTVPKRTVFLETTESQYHMSRRCALMRQQQWMRNHGEWQKHVYGTPAVKAAYKLSIREALKTQMEDRERMKNYAWGEAVKESILVAKKDYLDIEEDVEKKRRKQQILMSFTKANKEMMESRWREQRQEKIIENKKDSEQLKYNPINWSRTLK